MRARLLVNPRATATTARTRDVLVHALAGAGPQWDVEVDETTHRGHATEIAAAARREGCDLVMTLGGDGTVNETVNGLLADGPGPDVPLLAVVPGGSANVFARAIGLPGDPVEATGVVLEAIAEKRSRPIGLGTAEVTRVGGATPPPRWFCFNAGLGVDAEVIAAIEAQRDEGRAATPTRYVTTAARGYLTGTDRRTPALTLSRPGVPDVDHVFFAIVANTSPWTYLGPWRVDPLPRASFETGLDVWALRTLSLLPTLRYYRRMMTGSRAGSTRRGLTVVHDARDLTLSAARPIALQVDGDGLGDVVRVRFRSHPGALRVVC